MVEENLLKQLQIPPTEIEIAEVCNLPGVGMIFRRFAFHVGTLQAEIEQLHGVIFRNCPDPRDGVGLSDIDIIREIHQQFEPYCDCGDCNQEREEAAEAEAAGGE